MMPRHEVYEEAKTVRSLREWLSALDAASCIWHGFPLSPPITQERGSHDI
jgi:hypothetical protein